MDSKTPNYTEYSLSELEDALVHIDKKQFPERTQLLLQEIDFRAQKQETQVLSPKPEFKEHLHRNLIIRYWRGQVSLPMSYWVIGIIVSLFVVGLSKVSHFWIEEASNVAQLGISILLLYAIIIVLLVWYYVGVYRSATLHPRRGGSQEWAVIAKIMVLVGIISFSYQMYVSGIPIVNGAIQIVIGVKQHPDTHFRILNDGKDLEVMGGIEVGSEILLEEQLVQNPDLEIVHLHSSGGRILAAKRMMKLIRKYGLDTYVKTQCASACTLLFLAGNNRLLSIDGKLKFHAPSIGSASGHEITELAEELKKAYLDEGLPKWFVNEAMNTPSSSFWTPTNEELIKANVIDRVVNPEKFASSGLGKESEITAESIESGLLTHDYMTAMKEHDPEGYKQALEIHLQGMKSGKPTEKITKQFVDLLYNYRVPAYLASASNEALVEYWNAQVVHMEELKEQYPLACASFVFPNEIPKENRYGNEGGISPETQALESKAIAHLIRTYRNQHDNLDKEMQQSLIQEVVEKVREQSEDYFNVIVSAKDFVNQPDLMCSASIALNKAFLSFDVDTSGQLLRSIQ